MIRSALSVAIVALSATTASANGIGFKTDFLLKHCKAKDDLCAGYVAGVVDTYLSLMAGNYGDTLLNPRDLPTLAVDDGGRTRRFQIANRGLSKVSP
jgi:hypothetical protein